MSMYSKIFIVLIFGCGEKGIAWAIKNPQEQKKYISIMIDDVFLFKGNIVEVIFCWEK